MADAPMTDLPVVCGIDYSTKALDVALVRGRQLVSLERHALGIDLSVQVGVMCRLVEALHAQGVAVVVMETRWTRADKGIASAMSIRDVSTRLEALAIAAGLTVAWVPVNRWHAVILGNGGLKSAEAKKASVLYVDRVYGLKAESADQADAVCLATWAVSTLRLEAGRRLQRAG